MRLSLIAVLVFLILRQIMPIAAGLAGGVALSTLGALSRTIGWGMPSRGRVWSAATLGTSKSISAVRRVSRRIVAPESRYFRRRQGGAASAPG